jgi:hypothetical protein
MALRFCNYTEKYHPQLQADHVNLPSQSVLDNKFLWKLISRNLLGIHGL